MQVRKICQWCGKPFIAQKTTTCYCSHQCSNLGYKERIRERRRQLKRAQELLQPRKFMEFIYSRIIPDNHPRFHKVVRPNVQLPKYFSFSAPRYRGTGRKSMENRLS